MSNELTSVNNNFPSHSELQSVALIARTAHASTMYSGVGGEAKIMMILLAAKELGVGPCQALNGGIWSIQGKIEISARLMNGLIRRAGHSIKIIKSTDTECTLLGTRTDGDSFECSFTMEDATKAGLSSSNVWKKYPGDMLYNRCMSRLGRRLFSDVIGQCYIEGEIKEAKEIEKLEQAECEDVTKSPIQCKADLHLEDCNDLKPKTTNSAVDVNPPQKITDEQAQQMLESLAFLDDETNKQFYNILSKSNISSHYDLPVERFVPTMNWINLQLDRIKNTKQE